jgi:hypothetical protein
MYVLRDALTGYYVGQRDCVADVELMEDIDYALTFKSEHEAQQAHCVVVRMLPRAILAPVAVRLCMH